jgi:hypothetical protein
VLLSLLRALVYLATGYRTERADGAVRAVKGWRPLLHRDAVDHNILLRWPRPARNGSSNGGGGDGDKVYREVALGDFGFAIYADEQEQPGADPLYQQEHRPPDDPRGLHDVYQVADVVDEMRLHDTNIGSGPFYSQQLRDVLALGMAAVNSNGPTARQLLKTAVRLHREVNPPFIPLPAWAWEEADRCKVDESETKDKGTAVQPVDDDNAGGEVADDDRGTADEDVVNEGENVETDGDEGDEILSNDDGVDIFHFDKSPVDEIADYDDTFDESDFECPPADEATNVRVEDGEKKEEDENGHRKEAGAEGEDERENDTNLDPDIRGEGQWRTSNMGEAILVEEVEEDREEEAVEDIDNGDGTASRIVRKRKIHTKIRTETAAKKRWIGK